MLWPGCGQLGLPIPRQDSEVIVRLFRVAR